METAKKLQGAYKKLYTTLREYIWPENVVELIADLEISVYESFPNVAMVKSHFNRLKAACIRLVHDDEELNEKFDYFDQILSNCDDIYVKLQRS